MAAADREDGLILRIMLSCALRPSEVFALRVNDVELGRLRIDEAAVSGSPVKETKTDESNGDVPLSQGLEQMIRLHIAKLEDASATALLFPSELGTVP